MHNIKPYFIRVNDLVEPINVRYAGAERTLCEGIATSQFDPERTSRLGAEIKSLCHAMFLEIRRSHEFCAVRLPP